MDITDLIVFLRAVIKEIWINKFKVVIGGSAVAFLILISGMMFPTFYETSTTMYADNQNILKPLLAKQAEVSRVQDQVRVVRDVMLSPRILTQVVEELTPGFSTMGPDEREVAISKVRGSLSITSLGKSYIKILYKDNSAEQTYNVINKLTDLFIKSTSESQRSDSKEAFQFIDNQVKQYKSQLVSAEDRLKAFEAANVDGTAANVNSRLSKLRAEVEELILSRDEKAIRIRSFEEQLKEESQFSAKKYKSDVYRERIAALYSQRDLLLLTYKEDYPDVVSISLQIEDMEKAIASAALAGPDTSADSENNNLNPLYTELRSKLADAKVGLYATQRRLDATQNLVIQESERRKRIAAKDAELSELTRDYTVTKKIYEDMLEKKEKARMSMTLSIEGQGVAYKIQEPAQYPLTPVGLTFKHFVIAGLILGMLIPVGSIVLYVLVDPRIRFPSQLKEFTEIPVLAAVPHTITPWGNRIFRSDMIMMGIISVVVASAYVGLALAHRSGVI